MTTYIHFRAPAISRQRGAVLFISLVFLLLLTLLGIAASGNAILQERMTGGMRNRQLAMLGSESALRGGEAFIFSIHERALYSLGGDPLPPCDVSGGAQPCAYSATGNYGDYLPVPRTFRSSRKWSDTATSGIAYTPPVTGLSGTSETASLATQPRFLVEELGVDNNGLGAFGKEGGARYPEGGQDSPTRVLYRITARSLGGAGDSAIRATETVFSSYGTNHQFNPDAPPPAPAP